jgi:hypothetical protein
MDASGWITLFVVIILDLWVDRKFPCTCGRQRPWYFMARHERAGVMLGRALIVTTVVIVSLVTLSWFWGPVGALIATYNWRRWYFHEKDKLKKKAAKLAGVVGFNDHGKLVVKQVEA